MQEKHFIHNLKKPMSLIGIYRTGWVVLAIACSLYVLSFIIKASIVMHYEEVKRPSFEYQERTKPQKSARADRYMHSEQMNSSRHVSDNTSTVSEKRKAALIQNNNVSHSYQDIDDKDSFNNVDQNQEQHPGFASFFTHDLQTDTSQMPDYRSANHKSRRKFSESSLLGIRLAKGNNIQYVRRKWFHLKGKHRKLFYDMEPLIIKNPSDRRFPVQLIVGPFSNASKAVRLCKAIRLNNCNIKLYNGTPL